MSFKFDFSGFEKAAARLGLVQDEVPFALANAMSRAAYKTKDVLWRSEWPKHVDVRNKRFLGDALDVEPALARDFRAGNTMKAVIYQVSGTADLKRLALGGTKKSAKGAELAIPTKAVRRTSRGAIPDSQKPKNLKRTVRKGDLIFQAQGRGKNSRLKLMYRLKTSANIGPQVPFYSDFNRLYRAELYKAFPNAVRNVLRRNRLSGK